MNFSVHYFAFAVGSKLVHRQFRWLCWCLLTSHTLVTLTMSTTSVVCPKGVPDGCSNVPEPSSLGHNKYTENYLGNLSAVQFHPI